MITTEQFAIAERLGQCSRASDRVWLLGLVAGVLCALAAAASPPYWSAGSLWLYAGLLARGGLYLWAGDALRGRGGETFQRLFRMGLVAGLCALLVDWWLMHGVSSGWLVYPSIQEAVLLGSPVWRPVAWACVVVELGYPALRLLGMTAARLGVVRALVIASLLCAAAAVLTLGWHEWCAARSGWWTYATARVMLGGAYPLYVALGHGVIFLALPLVALPVLIADERPTAAVIGGGARLAAAIAAGYGLAYLLLESGWVVR